MRTIASLALTASLSGFFSAAPAEAAMDAAAPAGEQYLAYTGTSTLRQSNRFLYQERHLLQYREGRLAERVVLYTCRDGSAFARKVVDYVDATAPDFLFEDASNGMREGIRSEGRNRIMMFRARRAEAEQEAPLPNVSGLVADAGFDEFIRANWSALMAGKPQSLKFLVPSRLQAMSFQVQHLHSDAMDGMRTEVFRMKLSGVLGWVLPGIDVTYSADDHVLVRYDGLSDLRDASGDNFQTEIIFHPKDRVPSDAAASNAARQAHLAPCR